jgi:prevent-host-death family protein
MCYSVAMEQVPGTASGGARSPRARPLPRRIGVRELRQHASIYVDLAEKGHVVEITNRGRLVAQLVPAKDPESPLERLIAAGIVEPAEDAGSVLDVEPGPARAPGEPTLTELFLAMREDERY